MSEFKLEVGKSYRRRDGSGPVLIDNCSPNIKWPFEDESGETYTINGLNDPHLKPRSMDLVALWDAPITYKQCAKELAAAGFKDAALWLLQEKP